MCQGMPARDQGCDVMAGTCSCGEFKTVEEEKAAKLQRPDELGDCEGEVSGRFSEG